MREVQDNNSHGFVSINNSIFMPFPKFSSRFESRKRLGIHPLAIVYKTHEKIPKREQINTASGQIVLFFRNSMSIDLMNTLEC